jgi:hypothetical protein
MFIGIEEISFETPYKNIIRIMIDSPELDCKQFKIKHYKTKNLKYAETSFVLGQYSRLKEIKAVYTDFFESPDFPLWNKY